MPVFQKTIRLTTKGHTDVVDITGEVARIVGASRIRQGIVSVAGRGSTVAVTTIEYEPGAVADLRRALDQIAPANDEHLVKFPSSCGEEVRDPTRVHLRFGVSPLPVQ